LNDSPRAFADQFAADSQADAVLMVQGMLKLRQHGKLLWEEVSDVGSSPDIQMTYPAAMEE